MFQCTGWKGDPPRLLALSLQTIPMWLPKALFINIPSPPGIACMRCQEEPVSRGTRASLLHSTSWTQQPGTLFIQDEFNSPLLKTKTDLHPTYFHMLVLFSLWFLGTQVSMLMTEICILKKFLFLKNLYFFKKNFTI